MRADPADRCYSILGLSRRWACGRDVVRKLLRSGELTGFRLGGRVRITPEAVAAFEAGRPAVAKPRPMKRRAKQVEEWY